MMTIFPSPHPRIAASTPDPAQGISPSGDLISSPSSPTSVQPTPVDDESSPSSRSAFPFPKDDESWPSLKSIELVAALFSTSRAAPRDQLLLQAIQPSVQAKESLDDSSEDKNGFCLDNSSEDRSGLGLYNSSEDQNGYSPCSSSEDRNGFSPYSSSDDQNRCSLTVLRAAQEIPVGMNSEDEAAIIKQICQDHIGCPKSVQNLGVFSNKYPIVRPVEIFGGKMITQLPTAQGRLLFHIVLDIISDCHSQKKSWDGTFESEHIWIIRPRESREFIMIRKDPVEFEGGALLQAMANDLHKAAAILIPLYKVGNDYPVYFAELIEDLKGVTGELVANEGTFMEYLSYHPAIMPSTGRSTFVSKLNSIGTGPLMKSKPTVYPNDWRTIVESEIKSMEGEKDIIAVLNSVYYHYNDYDSTEHGLIRFMCSVLQQGEKHDIRITHGYELELYLAKMFGSFLPSIVWNLLDSGKIEQLCGEDWSSYKMSKWNKWEPIWSE